MTNIERVLARVRELDEAATTGPWVAKSLDQEDAGVHMVKGVLPSGMTFSLFTSYYEHPKKPNANLIAEYRSLAPQLAAALAVAVTALEDARMVGAHWPVRLQMIDDALAAIDAALKGDS